MTYDLSAQYYDLLYEAKKDYWSEALKVQKLIMNHLGLLSEFSGVPVLDVACGTGLHDQHLAAWFEVEGLDLSEAQLAIARQRLPEVTFHQADMTNFDLGQRFSAVVCLFSAIGYMMEPEQLHQAIGTMARHLTDGGILIVEPWLHPGEFRRGHIGVDEAESPELKIVRVGQSQLEGRITHLIEHHFIGRPEQEVEYFVEEHDLALYTVEEYLDAFQAAGLEVWHDPEGLMGRGLFIGHKMGPGGSLTIDSPFLTGAMNLYDPLPGYRDEDAFEDD